MTKCCIDDQNRKQGRRNCGKTKPGQKIVGDAFDKMKNNFMKIDPAP